MMTPTDTAPLTLADGLLWVSREEAVFVLATDVLDPRPVVIQGGGRIIWQMICSEQPITIQQLVEHLVELTDETEDSLRQEVRDFIKGIGALNLIHA